MKKICYYNRADEWHTGILVSLRGTLCKINSATKKRFVAAETVVQALKWDGVFF